jgi:hypothetical protein
MIECRQVEPHSVLSIDWLDNKLIDWNGGGKFIERNKEGEFIHSSYSRYFDACISMPDGQYQFLFTRGHTKGLLLKEGELLREINRCYYHAQTYEYPAAFVQYEGRTYLIHCPKKYSQIDFEDVETGELITNKVGRTPSSFFHSRFLVSPNGKHFLSRGWAWHPYSQIYVFDIAACIADPFLLDCTHRYPTDVRTEINAAYFMDNERILIASSDGEPPMDEEDPGVLLENNMAIWNFVTDEVTNVVPVEGGFGNLFVIDENLTWDMYDHPKIIHIPTGKIIASLPDLKTGTVRSSFLGKGDPQISFNRETGEIAVLKRGEWWKDEVYILSFRK